MARFEPTSQAELEQLIHRNRHLPAETQAERILKHLDLTIQHDLRDVIERDGISLTTRKARPHSRWVTDWRETE